MRMRFSVAAFITLLAACNGAASRDAASPGGGGTIVISASADPDILMPPLTMGAQGKQIVDQIFDNLADLGDSLNTVGDTGFKPRLARSWRWAPDSSWIEFLIDPRARWHDGKSVTPADVRFTFGLVKDSAFGSQLSPNLDEVDSVTVVTGNNARVWLSAHPPNVFFKIASTIAILPQHLLETAANDTLRASAFGRNPVGSGQFKFDGWKQGESVTLIADSGNYRGRPRVDRVVWLISPDYNSAALRFLAGDADFLDVVKPDFVSRAAGGGRRLDTSVPSLNYGYVSFNSHVARSKTPHPIFADRAVRRALVMSVDRASIVRNVLDTLGIVALGPFTRALPTSDVAPGLPYDTASASRILDSAGWKRGLNGVRSRGGRRLAFGLLVPSSSAIRMRFATLLQEQWRRIGADVKIDPIEPSAFGARLEAHDFDAMINAWQIDPDPGSVRDEWMSAMKRKGGNNFASYSNPVFDATVDSAAREPSPAMATALYRRAYKILTEDAAAMWLYESRNVFGISARIVPVGMRSDAWWADLANWSRK